MFSSQSLSLSRTPQLGQGKTQDASEMRRDADDWLGQSDAAERRKIQNRLHQRAWRRRQKLRQQQQVLDLSYYGPGIVKFRISQDSEQQSPERAEVIARDHTSSILECCSLYAKPDKTIRALALYRGAYEEYSLKAPRPANLPTLIRLNLLEAITRNSRYIGILPGQLCRDEFISPFNMAGPARADNPFPSTCPMSLQPTMTQHRIVHHPWIDLLPFPRVRDNLLLGMEAGTIDDDELSEDLMEFGSGDADLVGRPAMIVWGESSDYSSWEVNVAFVRKWGHLLRGCPELIVSTNLWRSKRGDKALSFKV